LKASATVLDVPGSGFVALNMYRVFSGAAVLAALASADTCCYPACGSTGCNGADEWCSQSKGNCEGSCHGTFCPAGPGPPSPIPTPPPPPPGPGTLYCLSKDDFVVAYSEKGVTIEDGGYTIKGDCGVATKSAFNLLGGYAEFTYDVSKANPGVNTNIYTISPSFKNAGGFVKESDYCDGAINPSPWCMEDDWVESNGPCGGATTLHTVPGKGQFCGAWGCRAEYHYNGQTKKNWRVDYSQDGQMTVKHGSETVAPGALNPAAKGSDWNVVKSTMSSKGVVVYSSQWGNWVPVKSCGPAAKEPSPVIDSSQFAITGMKIFGTVVQGPEPRKCSDLLNSTVVV